MAPVNRWCLFALPHQGGGCGLMTRTRKFEQIIKGMNYVSVWFYCWTQVNIVFDFKALKFFFPEGPWRPSDSQDPYWRSGEEHHRTQTHPTDERLGCIHDHCKAFGSTSVCEPLVHFETASTHLNCWKSYLHTWWWFVWVGSCEPGCTKLIIHLLSLILLYHWHTVVCQAISTVIWFEMHTEQTQTQFKT